MHTVFPELLQRTQGDFKSYTNVSVITGKICNYSLITMLTINYK